MEHFTLLTCLSPQLNLYILALNLRDCSGHTDALPLSINVGLNHRFLGLCSSHHMNSFSPAFSSFFKLHLSNWKLPTPSDMSQSPGLKACPWGLSLPLGREMKIPEGKGLLKQKVHLSVAQSQVRARVQLGQERQEGILVRKKKHRSRQLCQQSGEECDGAPGLTGPQEASRPCPQSHQVQTPDVLTAKSALVVNTPTR